MDETGLAAHLNRMRLAVVAALGANLAAAVASFIMPGGRISVVEPFVVTIVAFIACLWIGGSAKRDAGHRLDVVKRAFAATGDLNRLLRGHLIAYLVILARLLVMAAAGIVSAEWGLGARLSLPIFVLASAMILLTWPSAAKTRLLIDRANALRP